MTCSRRRFVSTMAVAGAAGALPASMEFDVILLEEAIEHGQHIANPRR